MTLAETLTIMAASVVTILTGAGLIARYLVHRVDAWMETMIDNSKAIRSLTVRVTGLERAIGKEW